jgi:hypothetical protein
MVFRRLAMVLGLVLLASCGKSGGDDDTSENFRTTFGYFLTTPQSSVSSVIMSIMGERDMELIQNQTGANQVTGLGFISGKVQDSTGTGIAGVTIQAHNDSGLPAGSIFYRSAITGAYVSGLTSTTATGQFVVINAQIGRVNIKCASGADGNLIVRMPGGTTVFAQLSASATGVQPTWSGVTQNLGATGSAQPGGPEPSVNYQLVGVTSAPGPTSDATTGAFNLGTAAARNTFIMKCTKAGFVDTHMYVRTVNANLTSGAGGGNVLIASVANRDNELVDPSVVLTPGTGIIRGRVMDGNGGCVVEARDANDQVVGTVMYGDNTNNAKPNAAMTFMEPDGVFYIYNVPPGQILIRATEPGLAANSYVEVFPDGITIPLDLTPQAQLQDVISISGALASLQGFAVPKGRIILHGMGIGDETDQFGEYTMVNVPTGYVFIVRTSK